MKYLVYMLSACLAVLSPALHASDLAKEQRWADQIVDAILDGEPEWLNDGTSDFLVIYTEADEASNNGVIVLHGTGVHPDWQQVVQPLRVELAALGWNTLSIQLPVLRNEAEYPEYAPLYGGIAPRINAAIDYMKEQGNTSLALVGHSQGATMGAYYLRDQQQDINTFVAIGMSGNFGSEVQDGVKSLQQIKLPVLDLYGSDDIEGVMNSISERAAAMQSKQSKQVKINGANHFFDDKDDILVESVQAWLQDHGRNVTSATPAPATRR